MGIIANTIIQQLGGRRLLKIMLGATKMVIGDSAISFNVQDCAKINKIRILYREGTDLYRVTFSHYNASTLDLKTIQEYEDISADQLVDLISSETGLCMQIPVIRSVERAESLNTFLKK